MTSYSNPLNQNDNSSDQYKFDLNITGSDLKSLLPSTIFKTNNNLLETSYENPYILIKALNREEATANLISIDLSWIHFVESSNDKPFPRKKIKEIITGIHNLIRSESFDMIDSVLSSSLNKNSSTDAFVTILRASYSSRDRLAYWIPILKKSKQWLKDQNKDYKQVLCGLV